MNVLLIQNFGGLGGGSRSGFDIAKVLCKLGHSVNMIIDNPSENLLAIAGKMNVNIVENHPPVMMLTFHNASGLWMKSLMRFLRGKKHENAWIDFFKDNNQYDLVVLNSSVLCCFCDILFDLKIKNLVIVRETFRRNILMNSLQQGYLKKSNAVAYLTEYDKKCWSSNENEFVLPEIVDEALFNDFDESSIRDNNFLYLGGLNYYKGAKTYLKAALDVIVKRPDLKCFFTILGDTYKEYDNWSVFKKIVSFKHYNYRNKCNRLIQKIQNINKDSINLVGLTMDISRYYKKCKAVVFPVQKVHQPRPAYEAGLFNKAIILPDYENFKDNVVDGVNGYFYKKNNWQSLAKIMIKIAENTNETILAGKKNRENTKKKHSLENAEDIMRRIVKSI